MKRFIASVMMVCWCSALAADEIRLRADDWFPVNGAPGAAEPGFGIEALQQIWGAAGHTLDYQLMSWSRSLDAVRADNADCVIGAYRDDAPDLRFPAEPLGREGVGVYVRAADDWQYRGPESLARRSVAIINEYSYGPQLDAWIADSRNATRLQMAYGAEALEGNVRKLLAGRVDVVFEAPMVMTTTLKRLDLDRFVRLAGEGKAPAPFYIACSATNPRVPQWLSQFDEGVQRMRASGEWQALLARYGLDGL
jgi:polar amino acid transport system substrate-binding protein